MRLDKYLKVSRIFKRRTVAKDVADGHKVYVNGRIAKPATDIKLGDTIRIVYGSREFTIRVLTIQNQANKEAAENMYEVLEEVSEPVSTGPVS